MQLLHINEQFRTRIEELNAQVEQAISKAEARPRFTTHREKKVNSP